MAIQLQLRRGTTEENNTFVGAPGEVTVDTTTDTLRIHDGETLGGIKVDKSENVVHKAESETITGEKTFIENSNIIIKGKSNTLDKTVTPQVNEYELLSFFDKNNVSLGAIGAAKYSDGRYGISLQCGNVGSLKLSAKSDDTDLTLIAPKNTYLEYAPDLETANTTDLNVATMGWVNDSSKAKNVVHRSDNETINGVKGFTSSPTAPTPTTSDNSTKVATTAFIVNILKAIYPVGSIYIGTQSTCPMATLIPNSTWTKIEGRYLLASGTLNGTTETYSATNTVAGGAPDITGDWDDKMASYHGHSCSGAIYSTGVKAGEAGMTSGSYVSQFGFKASLSNSIYGKSATIRSPAYVVNVWRRTA